jgi:hypothetical protein
MASDRPKSGSFCPAIHWSTALRSVFPVVAIDDATVRSQQVVADRFARLGLITKPVNFPISSRNGRPVPDVCALQAGGTTGGSLERASGVGSTLHALVSLRGANLALGCCLGHDAVWRDVLCDPDVTPNCRSAANNDPAEDCGASVNHDVIFDDRVSGVALDHIAFVIRGKMPGAERDGLINPHIISDNRRFAYVRPRTAKFYIVTAVGDVKLPLQASESYTRCESRK